MKPKQIEFIVTLEQTDTVTDSENKRVIVKVERKGTQPLIRCKDCRWFINKECAIYCLSSAHEETFCSYAEPKGETRDG